MKDILRIMRFDYLTAKPAALVPFMSVVILCFVLSLFLSPIINAYIIFSAMIFVVPLHSAADKSGFNRLYGILPVKRKNITRGRFAYIFLVHFSSEMISGILAFIANEMMLYRILPGQDTEIMQLVNENYQNVNIAIACITGLSMFFCFLFSYMEMMGQIYGRENEFRIVLITLAVITALLMGFIYLANRGMLPPMNIELPSSHTEWLCAALAVNLIVFALCILFGEITAGKLAKREL